MNLKVNITTSDRCKVIVQDLTNEYVPEEDVKIHHEKFKRSQVYLIDVLEINKTTGSIYKDPVYTFEGDTAEIPVTFDGWFTVNHIVIPSKEWFDNATKAELNLYTVVYYTDGSQVYKYINGKTGVVDMHELVERNLKGTNISRTQGEYVSICFLRKCYINLCQQIFNSRGFSSCWSKNNVDSELVYKRDLAWMAINVIKYLTECNQLAEVERIIESLQGCNGLCNQSNITSSTNGCGCSK